MCSIALPFSTLCSVKLHPHALDLSPEFPIMNMNSLSEKRNIGFQEAKCHILNEAKSPLVFFGEEIYEFQTHTHSQNDRSFGSGSSAGVLGALGAWCFGCFVLGCEC